MPIPSKTWLLKEKIKYLEDQVTSLKEVLELEKTCAKIDRILDKEKYDKMYDTALRISRDFMKYVESHPSNDDDSDDDSDDSEDTIISIDDRSPPVSSDEEEDIRECFGFLIVY